MNQIERELRDLHKKMDLIAEKLGAYEIATVATVMRRVHVNADGSETPVVDLYPAWNPTGTYGQYKIAHEYLNQDWQVERFEKFAGVKLEDLPLYNGQQALIRKSARRDKAEVDVAPFIVWTQPDPGATDEDKAKKQIIGYRRAPTYQVANTAVQSGPMPAEVAASIHQVVKAAADNGRQTPPPPPAWADEEPENLPAEDAEAHWEWEALSATEPFMFDTAILKLFPDFDNMQNVEKSRESWFGEAWQPRMAPAYLAGIRKFVEARMAGVDGAGAKKLAQAEFDNQKRALLEELPT